MSVADELAAAIAGLPERPASRAPRHERGAYLLGALDARSDAADLVADSAALRKLEADRYALLTTLEAIRAGAFGRQHKDPWAAAVLRAAQLAIKATEGKQG